MVEQDLGRALRQGRVSRRKLLAGGGAAAMGAMLAATKLGGIENAEAFPTYTNTGYFVPVVPMVTAIVYAQLIAAAYYTLGVNSGYVVSDPRLAGANVSILSTDTGPYFTYPLPTLTTTTTPLATQQKNIQLLESIFYEVFDGVDYEWDEAYFYGVVLGGYLGPVNNAILAYESNGTNVADQRALALYGYNKVLSTVYFPSSAFASLNNFLSGAMTINSFVRSVFMRSVRDITAMAPAVAASAPKLQATEPFAFQAFAESCAAYAAVYSQFNVALSEIAGNVDPLIVHNYPSETLGVPVATAGGNVKGGPFAPYTAGGGIAYPLADVLNNGYQIYYHVYI